ncbi:MAG: GTPase ObgE [Acidobacteriota bacterium]
MIFLDEAVIRVRGGRGGAGCTAFRREKFVAKGGPAGGDGGKGGSVWLIADGGLNTLYHLRGRSLHAAENGRNGEGSHKTGRSGADKEVLVPLGTQVFRLEGGEMVGEVLQPGERLKVAAGGDGGRGNARFATATNQAPRRSEAGWEGDELELRLELKLLADVGVVGLPNAGKSTLISRVTAAKAKIADYPFTTLVPQLGVVARGPLAEPFVIADLPGLIAGAASGAGLGIRFLKHIERCRLLVHLVDLSAVEGPGAAADLAAIEQELAAFREDLLERSQVIVGSKIDAALPQRQDELRSAAEARGARYLEISSVTGEGIDELVTALSDELARARAREDAE